MAQQQTLDKERRRQHPFDSLLEPGEELLWQGRPDRRKLFSSLDAYLIPITLILAVVCLPNLSVTTVAPGIFGLLIVIFYLVVVLVVLYMLAGRFYYKRTTRDCTYYAVTNRRVISVNTLWGVRSRSGEISRLEQVQLDDRGRRGSLYFTRDRGQSAWGESTGLPSITALRKRSVPAFYDVSNPQVVYELIVQHRVQPSAE